MFKKIISGAIIAAVMATTAAPTTAFARDRGHYGWQKGKHSYDRGYYRGYRDADYRRNNRYYGRGYACKRDNGTGGLVIGAIAGGLLGNEVARDKTAGTIIGGGVGALAGRAIDRADRC